ncbi:hypothetical protein F5Y03DRAFT_404957 [Xylaria venustula]|nr:hypothetical protein F5Y03DRAFT_404957 [Xylaria venustula]
MSYDSSKEDLQPKVTDTFHLDIDTDPYKPDPEETKDYFHGFSGSPRLVARTGHNRWTKTLYAYGRNQTLVQHEKCYRALEDPEIIGKWCKDLSMSIIKALSHCEWAYFFPIRTCLRDDRRFQESTAVTILLVAVKQASLKWEDGIKIALRCRNIMRKFMIFDVEVEIIEGQYTRHAASTQLEALVRPEYTKTTELILPLLSYPGYSIAYRENTPGEGTVGLHIKLGADESTVYGLTCRHVVCGKRDTDKHKSYKPSAGDRRYYISGNQYHLGTLQHSLDALLKEANMNLDWQRGPIERWDKWYQYDNTNNVSPPTEEDRQELQKLQALVDHRTSVAQVLKDIEARKERQIGHLAYSPGCSISTRQPGYLRDWALVELDVRKFTLPPANTIFTGSSLADGNFGAKLKLKPEIVVQPMPVSKIGQKTGLTHGKISGIEAVIRHPFEKEDDPVDPVKAVEKKTEAPVGGAPTPLTPPAAPTGLGTISLTTLPVEYSWEMLIVPEERASYFSQKGDSGSAVFNNMGHVFAIATASTAYDPMEWRGGPDKETDETPSSEIVNKRRGTDVTFATPIQWVLDDIEEFTGQKPRLA